jgi:hypothetical protein
MPVPVATALAEVPIWRGLRHSPGDIGASVPCADPEPRSADRGAVRGYDDARGSSAHADWENEISVLKYQITIHTAAPAAMMSATATSRQPIPID